MCLSADETPTGKHEHAKDSKKGSERRGVAASQGVLLRTSSALWLARSLLLLLLLLLVLLGRGRANLLEALEDVQGRRSRRRPWRKSAGQKSSMEIQAFSSSRAVGILLGDWLMNSLLGDDGSPSNSLLGVSRAKEGDWPNLRKGLALADRRAAELVTSARALVDWDLSSRSRLTVSGVGRRGLGTISQGREEGGERVVLEDLPATARVGRVPAEAGEAIGQRRVPGFLGRRASPELALLGDGRDAAQRGGQHVLDVGPVDAEIGVGRRRRRGPRRRLQLHSPA